MINLKHKNMIFFYLAIFLIIIAELIFKFSSGSTSLATFGRYLLIFSVLLFNYWLLSYTKLKNWLKITIAIILTPLVAYLLFFLIWGITNGFRFA